MDYTEVSVIWNPYENAQQLVNWIATYYSIHKDVGTIRKDCRKNLFQNLIASRGSGSASHFRLLKEDRFYNNVQPWDITFEELHEAYRTTAMKRHLHWDTAKLKEDQSCVPYYKIMSERGNFPRRIPWLFVDEGNNFCFWFSPNNTVSIVTKYKVSYQIYSRM